MDPISVLFDTDIGSNIDDALALAYLLRQPQCRLLGITTVSGAVDQRAALAASMCRAAGRDDVPIHCGASLPLSGGPGQPDVPHYEAMPDEQTRAQFSGNAGAIPFLRKTIRSSAQPVILLSTGPLTNIALLFSLDPEIPGLLRGFVSMAGAYGPDETAVETNCAIDPLAVGIVFEQWRRAAVCANPRVRPSLSIGLNVTRRCTMPVAEVRQRLRNPPLDIVTKMAGPWLSGRETVAFHDPLAAAAVLRPSLCGYAAGTVSVDVTPGSPAAGATHFAPSVNGPHRVATSLNPAIFFREFFSVF